MFISKLSNISNPFTLLNNNKKTENKNYSQLAFGAKLKPVLTADIYVGTPKTADRTWGIGISTSQKIVKYLEEPQKKIVNFITHLLDDLIANEMDPKNPIKAIKSRIKSARSISEKSGTRHWNNTEEVLNYMTDLNGLKIEMRDPNKEAVEKVLDRFIPLIKSRKLELLEVENKRPIAVYGKAGDELTKYDYASIDFLKKMIRIQEETWNGKKVGKEQLVNHRLEDDFTKANYCALHFLFRIPGKNARVFELQLMGDDTSSAKDVDDLIWKLLEGKSVDKKYTPIAKLFAPLTSPAFFFDEDNAEDIVANARKTLNKYRSEVFLFQREKEPMPFSKKQKVERFLPLSYSLFPQDIALKYGIDEIEFDFNNLFRLKSECDRMAKISEKNLKKAWKANAESKATKKTADKTKKS